MLFFSVHVGPLGLCVFSTVTMGEMELSCRAYVKMYLHCCLFPRCSINGLLLSSSTADGAVFVTDCVPLLHSHLPLAPITQLALTQVKPIPGEEPQIYIKTVLGVTDYSHFRWMFGVRRRSRGLWGIIKLTPVYQIVGE